MGQISDFNLLTRLQFIKKMKKHERGKNTFTDI